MSLACVGSARSLLATLGLTPPAACVLSLPTLLRPQVAPQGAGPELHALPRPKALRFRFLGTPQRHRLGWACVLCLPPLPPQPTPTAQEARSLMNAIAPGIMFLIPSTVLASVSTHTHLVCLISLLGSWSLAATLLADVNHPESQEVFG